MTTKTTKKGLKVSGIKTVPVQKEKPIQRRVSCETIANELTSRISGKLIGFDDLFDAKTNLFLTENELQAKGACFVTIDFQKVMVPNSNDAVAKSRFTKEPMPYILKKSKYQVITNIDWESYVNKRGTGSFVMATKMSNGMTNYENCKVIKISKDGNFSVSGVAFKSIEKTKYFDENGNELDREKTEKEFLKVASEKSKQAQADKHGIDIRFDPKYRTTRIDSCKSIRAFGFEYIPTQNNI